MWPVFFVATAVAFALMYLPGFLLLRGFTKRSETALCIAPLVSVGLIAAIAIFYGAFGIFCTPVSLLLPIGVLSLFTFAIAHLYQRRRAKLPRVEKADYSNLPLYFLVGLVATTIVFVKNLDGPDSFFQAYDNWMHLGMVRTFLESGNFSSINSLYASNELSPFIGVAGFYPSAWHAFVALVASLTNAPITLAVNAVNATIIAFVFTGSIKLLLDELFINNNSVLFFGPIAAVVTVSFPWDFIAFGPLYPNLLSLSLVPIACVIFMRLIDRLLFDKPSRKGAYALLFLGGCVAIVLAQPSGIFTMAVFLAPFLVNRTWAFCKEVLCLSNKKSLIYSSLMAVGIAGIWFACYSLPPLRNVVQFNWAATTTVTQAIVDVITFGMTSRPAQLVVAIFFYYGALSLWHLPKTRWILVPVAFSAIAYILTVSTEGFLKHLLSGFWYTDPHRMAALVGLFSVPVFAYGMARVFTSLYAKFFGREKNACARDKQLFTAAIGFITVAFALIVYPSFELRGLFYVDTPFGQLTEEIESQNAVDGSKVLTNEEADFSKKALALVPEDAVVINSPNDGSGFLYALQNARVLYRKFALPPIENEKGESEIIRHGLDRVATDQSVRKAVDFFDAKYLLILDLGGEGDEDSEYFWSYWPDQWDGIDAVNDETPGFTTLLSEGDMRLYRID
jgi:hypothetical protein